MKFIAINKAAKMQITEKLAAMGSVGSVELMRAIDELRFKYNSQAVVESQDVLDIDTRIFKYLLDLETDLAQNSVRVAQIRLKKINALIVRRASQCTAAGDTSLMTKADKKARDKMMKLMAKSAAKNGFDIGTTSVPIGELYSDADLYDIMIAQIQDENDSVEREIAELENQLTATPNDAYIQSKLTTTKFTRSSLQQRRKIMCDERNREAYVAAMRAVSEADKVAISKRTVSDTQLQAVQNEYNAVISRRTKEEPGLQSGYGAFMEAGNNAAAGSFGVNYDDSVGAPVTQSAGGAVTAKSFSALCADVEPLVKALERSRGIYAGRLDDLGKKLKAIDRELFTMLERRRDMSPSERLIFDAKIDSLNSERSGIVTSIKKYRQIQAINDDKMKLAKDLQQQMEINKVEAEAGRLSSLMQNWEQMAMELNKFVHSGNEELERMADANAVASSEEIEFNSATGTLKADAEIITSDDNKYEKLERELGLKD